MSKSKPYNQLYKDLKKISDSCGINIVQQTRVQQEILWVTKIIVDTHCTMIKQKIKEIKV